MQALWAVATAAMVAWIVLLVGRGLFWWPHPSLDRPRGEAEGPTGTAPAVAAIIPARNEAEILSVSLSTVVSQEYVGPFHVTLVDDRSDDGTAATARSVARDAGGDERFTVLAGAPLEVGWSGKVWALYQGTRAVGVGPEYLWFTDADIAHEPWVLTALVRKAEMERLDLVSTMATLRVDTAWDRLLIPAFVYFFAKLYPFRFVNSPRRRAAGAAGGCILVRRTALERAGGVAAIGSALIDDCALGRLIKRSGGRVWLGFSHGVRSVRGYGSLESVWQMVARSAYTQLRHSLWLLAGTVLAMLFLYALAPLACIGGIVGAVFGVDGSLPLAAIGGATWALMAGSFLPILRHHGVGWRTAPLLPAAGILYVGMTLSSAWRHARGRGGEWKGRTYAEARGGSSEKA